MKHKKMSKITCIFLFIFLSCALFAQERENTASVISQMAVYSQGLPQPDGSLLIAEDFTYGSEGIYFYPIPDGDLYIENGGILLRFSPEKPSVALVQGVWNGSNDQYVDKELKQYEYPHLEPYNLTLYCNEEKTQFITLTNSHKPAPCKGCDYMPPYAVTWQDNTKKETKILSLPEDLYPAPVGLPKYAFCKDDVFYYEHTVRNADKKSSEYWCYVIRAHHISTGKDEVFVPYQQGHCQDDLHGPMAIPGTDYLLYQLSSSHPQHTYIWMKKALK